MHLRRGQELGRGCGAPLCQSPPRSTRGPALIGAVLGGVGRADPETRAQPRGEVSAPVLPSTIKSERAFFPAAASTWPSAPLPRPAYDWGGPAAVTEGAKGRSSPDRQLGDRKVSPGADCGLEGDAPSPSAVTSSLPTEARAPQSLRWAPGRAGGGCGQGGREPGGDGLPVSSLRIPKKKATPSPPLGTLRRLLQATHSPGTASSMEWGDPS